jgi:hypothetical protein
MALSLSTFFQGFKFSFNKAGEDISVKVQEKWIYFINMDFACEGPISLLSICSSRHNDKAE